MGNFIDMSGWVFGRLTILHKSPSIKERTMWYCLCDCGKYCTVRSDHLRGGITSSCGCYRLERLREKTVKHGGCDTETYSNWEAMNQRCNNHKSSAYPNYGGRGIEICERWSGTDGYTNFLQDMGERPNGMSLDRSDVNGNYTPDNCRWVTFSTQSFNTRKNSNNSSGRTGVSWKKAKYKWEAYISKNSKGIKLGTFENFEDAVKAREKAELEYFGFNKD